MCGMIRIEEGLRPMSLADRRSKSTSSLMTLTVGCRMGQSAFGTTSAATCECERTSSRVYPVDPERLLLATRAGTASYLRGLME
jgi:hypothetical protein